ncbi:tRNA pseudouridine(38-40) synthase TruA [Anaeromyxobacter oryzae]|uniref:tRNA pseudouridine synthase A n=1 Tax=Anaeromyxobacter oryzae TaxID=2918170 RepID=A0ABM7X3M8_9BACT|nr:tRNA pseudouridine(38-40) synthase TruA [Anaeromyxobacter oryzae]BDG06395.1 tRNA pseudouridine synthase A [Anaeromyxobacter oryzae]
MERRFYALRLLYDGGHFRGFQRQPGLPTVQEALEDALEGIGVSTTLQVAARTDAGVHAVAQVVGFAARVALDPDALRRALNAALPQGILVLDAWRVPHTFHARANALTRTYVYLVGAPPPEPLLPYAWRLPDARAFPDLTDVDLDPATLRSSLAHAVGEHDFAGFARPGEQRGTVRTLLSAEVISADWAPLHAIVLEGKGFLRAMVRNLVGSAVTAGVGRAPPTVIRDLLAARGRYRGVRAPGWGLTLAAVRYPPGLLERPADPPGSGSRPAGE